MPLKLIAAALILFIALMLQLRVGQYFPWFPNLALATLVAFAFVLTSPAVLFFSLCVALVLVSGWGVSAELGLLILLPQIAALLKRFSLWRPWVAAPVTAAGIAFAFYLSAGTAVIQGEPTIVIGDAFASAVWSAAILVPLYSLCSSER